MKNKNILLDGVFGLITALLCGSVFAADNAALGQAAAGAGFGPGGAAVLGASALPAAAPAPGAPASSAPGPGLKQKRAEWKDHNDSANKAKITAMPGLTTDNKGAAAAAAETPKPNPVKVFLSEHKTDIALAAIGGFVGFALMGPIGILVGALVMVGVPMLANL